MIVASRLYEAILYVYALSLLFYFSDFILANRKAKRIGSGLLFFVWGLQFLWLATDVYGGVAIVEFSMRDTLLLYSWLLITLSLVVQRFFRIELFVFLLNLLGLFILVLPIFANPSFSTTDPFSLLENQALLFHVTLAITAYAAFAVAAIFSGMYLFLHRKLKEKQWSQLMKRLPSLEAIEQYMSLSVLVGAPLMLTALGIGTFWVWQHEGLIMLLDSKVMGSIIALGAYTLYIIQRYSSRTSGVRLAVLNLAAFTAVLVNLFISNYYSTFHQWVGVG